MSRSRKIRVFQKASFFFFIFVNIFLSFSFRNGDNKSGEKRPVKNRLHRANRVQPRQRAISDPPPKPRAATARGQPQRPGQNGSRTARVQTAPTAAQTARRGFQASRQKPTEFKKSQKPRSHGARPKATNRLFRPQPKTPRRAAPRKAETTTGQPPAEFNDVNRDRAAPFKNPQRFLKLAAKPALVPICEVPIEVTRLGALTRKAQRAKRFEASLTENSAAGQPTVHGARALDLD